MKNLLVIMAVMMCGAAFAQTAPANIDDVLTAVEQNNTALKALKDELDAQRLENKTGIYLPNPEVEFNYLWGNPDNIGNRNDINIRQTFDFPTVTGLKRKASERRNGLLELQYRAERLDILLKARLFCLDLIYFNALKQELEQRLETPKRSPADIKTVWTTATPIFSNTTRRNSIWLRSKAKY